MVCLFCRVQALVSCHYARCVISVCRQQTQDKSATTVRYRDTTVIIHHSSVISHHSSFISHQSSVISHQSSVISHHSSVISNQQSPGLVFERRFIVVVHCIVSHQSPVTSHQSPVTSHQPLIINQSSTIKHPLHHQLSAISVINHQSSPIITHHVFFSYVDSKILSALAGMNPWKSPLSPN